MSGYQTSGEMSGVASKVSGEVGPIGDEADAIGKSQISGGDGGRDFADKATAYATALHDNVIASVKAYGTATTTLSDKLTDTYQQYAGTDSQTSGSISTSGEGA
ncbi:MAG TPA: hypothetical protein VHV74_20320 [Pseudonocardiaceae bacterium]|nr:hypothetical protein [Pseudonocardiaceae bacterium]